MPSLESGRNFSSHYKAYQHPGSERAGTLRRSYASRPSQGSPIKILPLLAILAIGSGAYAYMVKKRASDAEHHKGKGPKLTPD